MPIGFKAKLFFRNRVDEAAVFRASASPINDTALSVLTDPIGKRRVNFLGSTVTLDIDLSPEQPWEVQSVLYASQNFSAAANVVFQTGATTAAYTTRATISPFMQTGGGADDQGADEVGADGWPRPNEIRWPGGDLGDYRQDITPIWFALLDTPIEEQFTRHIITDAGTGIGQIHLGRVYIGPYLEMTCNISRSGTSRPRDPSQGTESTSGVTWFNKFPIKEEFTFEFEKLTQAEFLDLKHYFSLVGRTEPFFFLLEGPLTDQASPLVNTHTELGRLLVWNFRYVQTLTLPEFRYQTIEDRGSGTEYIHAIASVTLGEAL